MSDQHHSDQHRQNHAFDYAPPPRGGPGTGALLFIGGAVVVLILALMFIDPEPDAGSAVNTDAAPDVAPPPAGGESGTAVPAPTE